jgi:DNA-binding NtrC family response regulator
VNKISVEALEQLRHHEYRDNFRELERILWQAVLYAGEEGVDTLSPHHLAFPSSKPQSEV